MLREVEYETVINMLRDIEGRLEVGSEVFDMVKECSKHSIKINTEFADTLRRAEADRKHQKYLDQKKREEEETEARHLKNLERMAKKDAIHADFGKKKMLRENVPEHRKYVAKSKKVKKDLDVLKYFGNDIDLTAIPEETDKQKREREEQERNSLLKANQSDSDDF